MIKPYLYAAIAVALLGSITGAYVKGRADGRAVETAQQAKLDAQVQRIAEAAQRAAASEIAKIEVKNVTIRQKAETITREVPVYTDCKHDPAGLQLVNEALTGGAKPSSSGAMPGTGSAIR